VKRLTRKIGKVLHLPAKNRLTAYSGQAADSRLKKIMKRIQQYNPTPKKLSHSR
jgi:hypothetical protein